MRQNYLICNQRISDSRKSIIGLEIEFTFHTISGNRYSEIDLRKSLMGNRYLEIDIHNSIFAQRSSEIDIRETTFANRYSEIDICYLALYKRKCLHCNVMVLIGIIHWGGCSGQWRSPERVLLTTTCCSCRALPERGHQVILPEQCPSTPGTMHSCWLECKGRKLLLLVPDTLYTLLFNRGMSFITWART